MIQDYTWDKSIRKEERRKCRWYTRVFVVKMFRIVRGKLLPQGINQARDLVSSLDAHVLTWGGLCCRVMGIKTKGRTVLSALIQWERVKSKFVVNPYFFFSRASLYITRFLPADRGELSIVKEELVSHAQLVLQNCF